MRALRAPPFFLIFYAFVCKKVPGKITEFFFFFRIAVLGKLVMQTQ